MENVMVLPAENIVSSGVTTGSLSRRNFMMDMVKLEYIKNMLNILIDKIRQHTDIKFYINLAVWGLNLGSSLFTRTLDAL